MIIFRRLGSFTYSGVTNDLRGARLLDNQDLSNQDKSNNLDLNSRLELGMYRRRFLSVFRFRFLILPS